MHERKNVSTRTTYEDRFRYSRAVRIGPHIWTAGTLAIDDDGNVPHIHSPYQQTLDALNKLEKALKDVGATRADVVRTRMYIVKMNHSEDVGRAHAEFFGDTYPCATMIEIKGLAHPHTLVEVELEAYTVDGTASTVSRSNAE